MLKLERQLCVDDSW